MHDSNDFSNYQYMNGQFFYRVDSQNVLNVSEKIEHLNAIKDELNSRIKLARKQKKLEDKITQQLQQKQKEDSRINSPMLENISSYEKTFIPESGLEVISEDEEDGGFIDDLFHFESNEIINEDDNYSDDHNQDDILEKHNHVTTAETTHSQATPYNKVFDIECAEFIGNTKEFLLKINSKYRDECVYSNHITLLSHTIKSGKLELLNSNNNDSLFIFYTGNSWLKFKEYVKSLGVTDTLLDTDSLISVKTPNCKIDIIFIPKIETMTFSGNLLDVAKEIRTSGYIIKDYQSMEITVDKNTIPINFVSVPKLFLFKLLYGKALQGKDRKIFEKMQNEIKYILYCSSKEDIKCIKDTFADFSSGSSHWDAYIEGALRATLDSETRNKYSI